MADISTYKELGKYHCSLRLGKYRRPKPFDKSDWEPSLQIVLPLPLELRDDTRTDYDVTNMETVGDIINRDASGVGAAVLRNTGNIAQGLAGAATSAARQTGSTVGQIAGTLGDGLRSLAPAEQITSAVQQMTGLAPNPNQAVMLRGPVLREFNFSWMFYPYNEEETKNIKKMIDELKRRSLPSARFSTGAAVLKYPELCQINFYPWDKGTKSDNNYGWTDNSIIRIKKCFISAVNVSYTPGGPPAFFAESHMPVAIQMNIALKEAEYMLSEDYGTPKQESLFDSSFLDNLKTVGGQVSSSGATLAEAIL